MEVYKDGIYSFVKTLKDRHGITLNKDPSWQTIYKRATKVLKEHRAYRNKQDKVTGDGDKAGEAEPVDQRMARQHREKIYDEALALWLDFEESKKTAAEKREEQRKLDAQLTAAGHGSRAAAMANIGTV